MAHEAADGMDASCHRDCKRGVRDLYGQTGRERAEVVANRRCRDWLRHRVRFLSLTFKTLPMGVAYAVWSGAGTALVAVVGWFAFKQSLGAAELIGISMIITGVAVLQFGAAQS
jgi:hypothetical protein